VVLHPLNQRGVPCRDGKKPDRGSRRSNSGAGRSISYIDRSRPQNARYFGALGEWLAFEITALLVHQQGPIDVAACSLDPSFS